MTGYNSMELELEVREQGILFYLTKPFSMTDLKEIVDHISNMKRREADQALYTSEVNPLILCKRYLRA